MTSYKHTQIGYLIIVVTLCVIGVFAWAHMRALAELPSVDSGTNLFVTAVMILIVLVLISFTTLTVSIDEDYLRVRFSYGIFRKKFSLQEITSVRVVKNHWYYGWGIRLWLRPKTWIYNVSGFDAVEIMTKNGALYRIGTDNPKELEIEINKRLNKLLNNI